MLRDGLNSGAKSLTKDLYKEVATRKAEARASWEGDLEMR
jgi:hypothetical protein